MLAAIAVLDRMGLTLNTMTLGGFAVALGVLVDDAIIGIENILRRLRENALVAQPPARLDIIREASLEVRGPVIYATAVVIAVFLPEIFTSSVQGHFVGPLALAFIFAVLRLAPGRDDHDSRIVRAASALGTMRGLKRAGWCASRRGRDRRCTGWRPTSRGWRSCWCSA